MSSEELNEYFFINLLEFKRKFNKLNKETKKKFEEAASLQRVITNFYVEFLDNEKAICLSGSNNFGHSNFPLLFFLKDADCPTLSQYIGLKKDLL